MTELESSSGDLYFTVMAVFYSPYISFCKFESFVHFCDHSYTQMLFQARETFSTVRKLVDKVALFVAFLPAR